jgi:two-component system cell cycle response regulator
MKILIAEDNAVNRELLRELLEMRGHTVVEACNGEEALLALAESKPEILLLDLGIPALEVYRTVSKFRKTPDLAKLTVITVTTYEMQGDREKVLSSGFDGYLSKPINSPLLFQELERLVSRTLKGTASGDRANAATEGR